MQPSTRELDIDIESLIETERSYITIYNEFGFQNFLSAKTPDDLDKELFSDKDGWKVEFLVSTSKDMVSKEVKVLIPIQDSFYHFFMDSLALLLRLHRQDPSLLFVLYIQRSRPSKSYEDFLVLMFNILDSITVKYKTISTLVGHNFAPVYEFDNYILIDENRNLYQSLSFVDINHMINLALQYSKTDKNSDTYSPVPFRKVYLTRGGKGSYLGPIAKDYKYYKDDLRMYEEEKLEKFFGDLGYEIVEPETKFDSIMEQINYMREVKSLVAVTCSGLMNMLFMQDNQTVIEIQVELVQVMGGSDPELIMPLQNLHSYYQSLSFVNKHTFISIPSDRDPDKVIEALSKDSLSYIL